MARAKQRVASALQRWLPEAERPLTSLRHGCVYEFTP